MRKAFVILLVSVILFSCTSSKKIAGSVGASSKLRFINEYVVASHLFFKGTAVGGLSGIDYNPNNGLYYLISDDRSDKNPARLYTAKIHVREKGIDSVEFIDVIPLLDENGRTYPGRNTDSLRTPDPESVRYNPRTNELVWSSEGERVVNKTYSILIDPAIYNIDMEGKYKAAYHVPPILHMQSTQKGPRKNAGFEGITFSEDYRYLFASVEEPLFEDGHQAGSGDSTAWVRIIKFDVVSKMPVAQYAYKLDAVPHPPVDAGGFRINGISEIFNAGNDRVLVIERAFSQGRSGNNIRLYLADFKNATDISMIPSLKSTPPTIPITKKLLFNMDDLGRYIDNVEGVTFGPTLPNGHRTLILVADDNFDDREKTQFFLFEVIE